MLERGIIKEGMVVRSLDGEKLGKVVSCESSTFIIEKGLFFPTEYTASYGDVHHTADGEIYLSKNRDAFADRERTNWTGDVRSDLGKEESKSMTLGEERLEAEKREREAGEVRVGKEVVQETKSIEVPVTRERATVERVPVDRPAAPGELSFKEEETRIPLKEEEVEIHKRPVVREEVRVKKTPIEETRTKSDTVKKEVAKVREKGDVDEDLDADRDKKDIEHRDSDLL
jgi:uncharacterized protein (TIGR02271 family)